MSRARAPSDQSGFSTTVASAKAKGKPILAEDLQLASAELLGQLEAAKEALAEKISGVDRRLAEEVQRLDASLETLGAAAARLEGAEEELGRGLRSLGTSARATEARLDSGIQAVQEAHREALSEQRARQAASDEALDRTLLGLRASADAAFAEVARLQAALAEKLPPLEVGVEALSRGLERRALSEDTARLEALLRAAEARAVGRAEHEALEARLDELARDLGRRDTQAREQIDTLSSTTEATISSMSLENQRNIAVNRKLIANLQTSVEEAASCATRRVEWLIHDASALPAGARDPGQEGRMASWRSPPFEAACAHGLWLELRVHEPPAEGEAGGDCEVGLWGPRGLNLVCRLHVGGAAVQRSHTFDGEGACESGRLGALGDLVAADGSLRLGVEILEATREVAREPPVQTAASGGSSLSKADQQAGGELCGGEVTLHRYLNHRTLDLVQGQVELMQSRMVRRIEWDVQQASLLQHCFPGGEALCSTAFEAAGIQDLQLVFYPSGGPGAREGWCSYFVHCPAGSSLRCALWAGRQRREAKLAFEEQGHFGRTNFCRFDQCLDPLEDVVRLALEIDEAQQQVTETLVHTRVPPSPSGALPPQTARQLDTISSSLCLKRAPGREELKSVRQLPSIWTGQPLAGVAEALDGFRSFGDLKATPRKRTDGMGPGSPLSPLVPPGSARGRARPVVQIDPKYSMYAS